MNRSLHTPLLLTATLGLLLTACGGQTPTAATPARMPTAFSGTLSALNLQAGTATVAGSTVQLGQVNVTRNGHPVSTVSLAVGQQVDVTAAGMTAQDTAAGSVTVDIHAELEGEVSAVDVAAGTVTVAGQVVTLDSATQIHLSADRDDTPGTGTIADLTVGVFVEVSVVDPAASPIVAASIEVKDERERADDDRDPKAHTSHLRGMVSGLNTQAHTFTVGNVTVDYSAAKVQGPLADGVRVNMHGTYDDATHTLSATTVEVNGSRRDGSHEGSLYGTVGSVDSAAHTFTLGSVTIDYAAATVTGTLTAGARVEVEGTVDPATHVLSATTVEVRGTRPAAMPGVVRRVEGRVRDLDGTAHTFTLRGMSVDYTSATVTGTLRDGAEVHVTGSTGAGTPNQLTATTVEAESGH